jgi:hypothetical protein
MHRNNTYPNVPPAHSPPLHHPVPQHVSTVPQLRSPPPPAPQPASASSSSYGYQNTQGQPQGQPQGQGFGAGFDAGGSFNQFRSDPMAAMAFQALKGGMDMANTNLDQNLSKWINVTNLKQYFNVSNSYVVSKLWLVLCPWRHRSWTRAQRMGMDGQDGFYLAPRDDPNAPDMYIPLMALITYILLSTLLAGLRSAFHPEIFGTMASKAIISVGLEIMLLKAAMYFWLNINSQSQWLDLVAYSGYKFVSVIVTVAVSEIWNRGGGTGGLFGWAIFLYTFSAVGFFLVRSLSFSSSK